MLEDTGYTRSLSRQGENMVLNAEGKGQCRRVPGLHPSGWPRLAAQGPNQEDVLAAQAPPLSLIPPPSRGM